MVSFKIQKERWVGLQFTRTDYLSLVLAPLRIHWKLPFRGPNLWGSKCWWPQQVHGRARHQSIEIAFHNRSKWAEMFYNLALITALKISQQNPFNLIVLLWEKFINYLAVTDVTAPLTSPAVSPYLVPVVNLSLFLWHTHVLCLFNFFPCYYPWLLLSVCLIIYYCIIFVELVVSAIYGIIIIIKMQMWWNYVKGWFLLLPMRRWLVAVHRSFPRIVIGISSFLWIVENILNECQPSRLPEQKMEYVYHILPILDLY